MIKADDEYDGTIYIYQALSHGGQKRTFYPPMLIAQSSDCLKTSDIENKLLFIALEGSLFFINCCFKTDCRYVELKI